MFGKIYFDDVRRTLALSTLIMHRSAMEVKSRYKRTLIGPFWTSLSMAIFVISFGVIGAQLWHNDVASYMPFFCAGYMTWILISSIINESRAIFAANREMILSTAVPMHVFVLELVIRNFIVFAHHLVVFVLVLAFFSVSPSWNMLMMIPGMLIIFVASVLFAPIWAIACTRYQDLSLLSQNILQIIFFVTPIMWPVKQLSGSKLFWLVDINPIYHFVEILRGPMLGEIPPWGSYIFTIGACGVILLLSIAMFEKFRQRIVFWI